MSIKKVMMMFALLTGIACATYAQGVSNDSTATAKEDGLKLTKEVYPQAEEDGDLYHGLTKKLMFDRMIPPHGLEVTYDKTVHILFPAAVRYVDLGSPNLIAGKADGAENVIRVKATVKDFRSETNMSVITEDGSFYTFNVKYADEPLILNVEMKDFIHDGSTVNRPNNAQEIYLKELGSESPMLVHLIMKSLHKENKRKVKHIGCKRFGVQYILKGIYVHNGLLYFHTEIKNQSNVPFDVDYITFKIVDKQVAKRTAMQEQVLFPLRAYNYAVRVAGKQSERTVFCLRVTRRSPWRTRTWCRLKPSTNCVCDESESHYPCGASVRPLHGTGGSPAVPAEDARHRVESRAERGGRLCAGSRTVKLRQRRRQVGVRGGIPANQPRIPEYDYPCGTVHGGGRLLLQLPLGREKGGVLLRGRVSPCRV